MTRLASRSALRLAILLVVLPVAVCAVGQPAERGWLGFGFTYPRNARGDADAGLVVIAVLPESPAEKAGLQEGDVVLALDGSPVVRHSEASVLDFILGVEPGQEVELAIRRGEERRTLRLTALELPPQYLEGWLRLKAARDRLRALEAGGRS